MGDLDIRLRDIRLRGLTGDELEAEFQDVMAEFGLLYEQVLDYYAQVCEQVPEKFWE